MTWDTDDKVVVRYRDGKLLKGNLTDFSVHGPVIKVRPLNAKRSKRVDTEDLKAIFFVRTFEGDRQYREKRVYEAGERGRKVFVKFKDGESIIGYMKGESPWKKGFFLSNETDDVTGFFIMPVDDMSNNIRIYVFKAFVADVARIG